MAYQKKMLSIILEMEEEPKTDGSSSLDDDQIDECENEHQLSDQDDDIEEAGPISLLS